MTEEPTGKIAKTEAEWRQQLTPEQYRVALDKSEGSVKAKISCAVPRHRFFVAREG